MNPGAIDTAKTVTQAIAGSLPGLLQAFHQYQTLGIAAVLCAAASWAAGRFLPGLLGGRLRAIFLKVRASGFWAKTPKRRAFYLAFLELVENEVPDPGDPAAAAWFAAAGVGVAAHVPVPVPGLALNVAKLLHVLSDETDADFKAEIAAVRAAAGSPPPS